MELTVILVLLLQHVTLNESFKILGIFHSVSKSHFIAGGALMKGLANKGHEVTVISPYPQNKPLKNFRDVAVLGVDKLLEERLPSDFLTNMDNLGLTDKINVILNLGILMTNFTLNHEVFLNFLRNSNVQYDVIVMEILMNEAFLGIAHHFNAPVIGFSTFGANIWSNDMVGNPSPMSFVPNMNLKYSDKMTFGQRVMNVLACIVEKIFTDWFYMPRQEAIYNAIFPDPKPRLEKLQKNVSLVLLNNHFTLSFPRPYVPNMVEVGGLQINRTPKRLPTDLQQLLDEAEHGVIYFSLGSIVKPGNIPNEKQKDILNVFRKLKQKVLWKWDDSLLDGKPDNVYVKSWFPQDDLLAHSNVKLFITHGGLLSITETIHHAVPVIGIPIYADQHINMARAENAGYAITINLKDLNEESLSTAITEILSNDKYAKKVKLLSERYRDQPLTPLETAIYWTEYVARHKGAPHMRSAGLDLSFFAYHSLDVFAALCVTIYLVWRLIKAIFWRIACRKRKNGGKSDRVDKKYQ